MENNHKDATTLLSALWRAGGAFGAVTSKKVGYSPNFLTDCDALPAVLAEISSGTYDTFFAPAQFATSESRVASNVIHSFAFWLDIDCGDEKVQAGKGYENADKAQSELNRFCRETELPVPTHIVLSGGGVHAYWVLSEPLEPERWKGYALKLKCATVRYGLLADPARTADITSLMRLPGTRNYKEKNPRPVSMIEKNSEAINTDRMLQALDAISAVDAPKNLPHMGTKNYGSPNLNELKGALKCLDPDCGEEEWKLRRIAPLARASHDYPELSGDLLGIAESWSRGALWGTASQKWISISSGSGKSGSEIFLEVWQRFAAAKEAGKGFTLGTLFADAKANGWNVLRRNETDEPLSTKSPVGEAAFKAALEQLKKNDVGAPFEKPVLNYLRHLLSGNQPAYERAKAAIKDANKGVNITSLERAVRQSTDTPRFVRPTHNGYAQEVLNDLTYGDHQPVTVAGELFAVCGKTGLWEPQSTSMLERKITGRFDNQENCRRMTDYSSIAAHCVSIAENNDFFESAPVGVACQRQFFTIDGKTIVNTQLQPEHKQRVMLRFTPTQENTPLFSQFLHDTFKSDVLGEEAAQIRLMQEFAGAVLTGVVPRFQKAVFWYDPYGRAGKGTMQSILERLVPREFRTAVSPFHWADEYYLASLANSRFNVAGELPENKPIPAAEFKSVVGMDLMMGRSPTKKPFSFKNDAAHLFMSNHLITTTDHSEAFYSRWILFEFPNSRIKSGLELDIGLGQRIADAEMAGIAYWALQGASRLLEQGKFSESPVHTRLMNKWRANASSLRSFVEDNCLLGEKLYVRRSVFYVEYVKWCSENGRKAFSKGRVRDTIDHDVALRTRLAVLDGIEIFRGVAFKDPELNTSVGNVMSSIDSNVQVDF